MPTTTSATPEKTPILIVDDSLTARKIVVDALSARGFTTLEAKDGKEGLSMAQEHQDISLIFSDIIYSVWDNYSICKVWKIMIKYLLHV